MGERLYARGRRTTHRTRTCTTDIICHHTLPDHLTRDVSLPSVLRLLFDRFATSAVDACASRTFQARFCVHSAAVALRRIYAEDGTTWLRLLLSLLCDFRYLQT